MSEYVICSHIPEKKKKKKKLLNMPELFSMCLMQYIA